MKKHELVQKVTKDYKKHISKMEDMDYYFIWKLIESLEAWDDISESLKNDINIIDDFLYINNIKICKMDEIYHIALEENDCIEISLDTEKVIIIKVKWLINYDSVISHIYCMNTEGEEDIMLYGDKKTRYNTNTLSLGVEYEKEFEEKYGDEYDCDDKYVRMLYSDEIYETRSMQLITDEQGKTCYDDVFNIKSMIELLDYSKLEAFIEYMLNKAKDEFREGYGSVDISLGPVDDSTPFWEITINNEDEEMSYRIYDYREDFYSEEYSL